MLAEGLIDPRSAPICTKLRATLNRDTPDALYFKGNLDLLRRPAVGFCGSRKATASGLEAARECALEAVRSGLVVVSGNANGVDFEAHLAAMATGGETIFVLPEGIDRFRIKKDFKDFWSWDRTLVLSQWDPRAIWRSYQAMARNKTIIGLSDSLVVVEAGETGGTKHAGENALFLSVPLFVLEYREVTHDRAGNAALIQSGGRPIRRKASSGRPSLTNLVDTARQRFFKGPKQRKLDL